jgi:hypothetical protein
MVKVRSIDPSRLRNETEISDGVSDDQLIVFAENCWCFPDQAKIAGSGPFSGRNNSLLARIISLFAKLGKSAARV